MQSLEALILFDMLAAYGRTLEASLLCVGDRYSDDGIAAQINHLVAHKDLYKGLHELAPGQRLAFSDGRGVAADNEGGLIWSRGRKAVAPCS